MRISDWRSDVCSSDLKLRKHRSETLSLLRQRRLASRRENQQVERWLMTAQRRRWRLFHNHMGIGAAHAERAHAGAPRPLRSRPMAPLGIHVKRAAREIEPWLGSGKVDLRWKPLQNGRASSRGRGWQYVVLWVVAVSLQKQEHNGTQ